jgi:hypothetical protein
MGRVSLHSEIAKGHPDKPAVERTFDEVLGSDRDSWTVMIRLVHGIFWTVFLIRESDGFRKVLLLDTPEDQQPEAIATTLRRLLDEANPARASMSA